MNVNSYYDSGTKVLKGKDALNKLCEECLALGDKVLVVFSGDGVKQSGLYARIVSLLNICGINHITYECRDDSELLSEVEEAKALGLQEKTQLLLAIGNERLLNFTKMVAHNFYDDADVNHLPIISVSSEQGAENINNTFDTEPDFPVIKLEALFLDFEY